MSEVFGNIKKVHFIGIGGIGMSGIAEYLAKNNYVVSGSDSYTTEISERLKNFGITIHEGHNTDFLLDDTELVIYSAAVKEDNPEYIKSVSLNIPTIKRAKALGEIVNDKFLIAVSGTHGKTTTTSMVAKILIENDLDPTVFVGGNLSFLDGSSSRIGNSNIAVVEADEYDRSFLTLKADVIIVNNIESDHLDIYENLEDIQNNFIKFCNLGKENCKVILNGDDENVRAIAGRIGKQKMFFGFDDENDFVIDNITYSEKTCSFKLNESQINLSVIGRHNMLNSSAAFLAARETGLNDEQISNGLQNFGGVKRRFELKFTNGIRVYDDYAHHPTEVKATLEAARSINLGRIITVFQPHLYSRTKDFYKAFSEAFAGTDILILDKIYPARELPIEGVTSDLIFKEFNKNYPKEAYSFNEKSDIFKKLKEIVKDKDIVIFQGAGTITNYCDEYVSIVKNKY
ncbi:MAG: UDP-N-acetylmuramate--L-alanine ligase [Bacteroidetes bacterium]|nr:UDP-N-acetylmuramate--L-alanine ligase [Bacteroidota bacterium]